MIDLACFQRQDRGLAGQEADLLAREREVAAEGERLVQVSAIAQSTTQVLNGLRVGLGQASSEQRRQLVELLIDRVVVTDGQVEIRYVIPTTDHSTKTRFCHLRTDYFDLVALAVADPVEPERPARPPGAAGALVGPLRDGVRDATAAQQEPTPRIAVTLVADHVVGPLARPTPPARPRHPDRVQDRLQLGTVMPLAGGEHHAQRPAAAVAAKVNLGGQPAPGTAKRLGLVTGVPPLVSARAGRLRAPAACWWARTLVASTLTTHSSSPTASDLVWAWANSRSQVPSRRQRTKRS